MNSQNEDDIKDKRISALLLKHRNVISARKSRLNEKIAFRIFEQKLNFLISDVLLNDLMGILFVEIGDIGETKKKNFMAKYKGHFKKQMKLIEE